MWLYECVTFKLYDIIRVERAAWIIQMTKRFKENFQNDFLKMLYQ